MEEHSNVLSSERTFGQFPSTELVRIGIGPRFGELSHRVCLHPFHHRPITSRRSEVASVTLAAAFLLGSSEIGFDLTYIVDTGYTNSLSE